MRLALCILLGYLLSACGPSTNSADDYVERLENILGVSGQATKINAPAFPKPRELQIELAPSELSIREFLSLRECKLHNTIAQRNSLLGKVAEQSQLLFNDIQILAEGPACLTTLGDSSLAIKLAAFIEKKQNEIDQSLWRGLLAQQEHAKFWSVGDAGLDARTAKPLEALAEFVISVQAGNFNFSKQQFDQVEQHLGALRFANSGELLQRYAELLNAMSRANSVVRQRLDQPLCLNGQPTQTARNLNNVVSKYFIAKVQRDAVELNSASETIMRSHQKLESPLIAASNKAYQQWVEQRNNLIELGRLATTTHAKLLQKLYQQCGLNVGTRPTSMAPH